MASVKFGIGVVGVVVVAFANVATTWAQSNEVPRRLRERISRTRGDARFPATAAPFDTEVKITPSDPSEAFGGRFAVSGDTAILITRPSGLYNLYVYRRNEGGRDNWGEVGEITRSDGADPATFGASVALSGDTAIVSAYGPFAGPDLGAAYVYQRDKGGIDSWGEVTQLVASGGTRGTTSAGPWPSAATRRSWGPFWAITLRRIPVRRTCTGETGAGPTIGAK